MKIGKYSPENLLKRIIRLDPVEFMGICKILGIKAYNTDNVVENVDETEECAQATVTPEPRDFTEMWADLCDKVDSLNRTQRRNLGALVYAATKKGEKD